MLVREVGHIQAFIPLHAKVWLLRQIIGLGRLHSWLGLDFKFKLSQSFRPPSLCLGQLLLCHEALYITVVGIDYDSKSV